MNVTYSAPKTGICSVCKGNFNLTGVTIEPHYTDRSERTSEFCDGSHKLPYGYTDQSSMLDGILKLEYDNVSRLGLPVAVSSTRLFPPVESMFSEEIKRDRLTNQLATVNGYLEDADRNLTALTDLCLDDVKKLDTEQLNALIKTRSLFHHAFMQFRLFQVLMEVKL